MDVNTLQSIANNVSSVAGNNHTQEYVPSEDVDENMKHYQEQWRVEKAKLLNFAKKGFNTVNNVVTPVVSGAKQGADTFVDLMHINARDEKTDDGKSLKKSSEMFGTKELYAGSIAAAKVCDERIEAGEKSKKLTLDDENVGDFTYGSILKAGDAGLIHSSNPDYVRAQQFASTFGVEEVGEAIINANLFVPNPLKQKSIKLETASTLDYFVDQSDYLNGAAHADDYIATSDADVKPIEADNLQAPPIKDDGLYAENNVQQRGYEDYLVNTIDKNVEAAKTSLLDDYEKV